MRSPPGKYSIMRYKLSVSWKEHLSPTTHGFFSEFAKTFLYYRDCTTLFLKIISDFLSFFTATGSPFLAHLHSLTSPNAPLPIIFTEGNYLIVSFIRSFLSISASSCIIFFLRVSCSCTGIPSICIFLLSCSQYYFFCCSCWISFEYLCSIKFLAASTFSFVELEMVISFVLSFIQMFKIMVIISK